MDAKGRYKQCAAKTWQSNKNDHQNEEQNQEENAA